MMTRIAPPEFAQMGLSVSDFKPSDKKSWRGPCPRCGGHRRFVVFTDKEWPHWNCLCDSCGFSGWADQLNPQIKSQISEDERAAWKAREDAERERAAAERRNKLASFTTAELWIELHERMTDANRLWWEHRGIPRDWQDWWQLGYVPHKTFEHNGTTFERSAYSIPKFDLGWRSVNMDFRIVDPPDGVGKYRPMPGLPAAAFLARPDLPDLSADGTAFVVEGSIKAMVLCTRQTNQPQVVGLPGCRSWAGMVDRLAKLDRVYVILDPDAQRAAHDLAKEIGANARIVSLPAKVDDAILQYGLKPDMFAAYLKQARAA